MEGKLVAAIREKRLSLGITDTLGSAEIVELVAYCGFDWIIIDQMFTAVDWGLAAHMIRAAKGSGMDALVRVPAYPWSTRGDGDSGVVVDISRALGIGATGVTFSAGSVREVELAVEAGQDWHRRLHILPFDRDMADFARVQQELAANTVILPLIESAGALKNIEEILQVDGLLAITIGISDASRELGHPFDYEHPEVWRFIDQVANMAEKRGVVLGGNTGFHFQRPEAIAKRVKRMNEHGIRIINMQLTATMLQVMMRDVLAAVKSEVSGALHG